ncbi:MAG: hypothetical protein JL50_16500 [Peptococcaceae bacterium BICA1-7]|nr:MAG: hypothetical protein JL50_16500 [Peptococcaceae bacterium BICA1-7]HBV96607.1 hypothetical protein [Desulfotomaculum sp.]
MKSGEVVATVEAAGNNDYSLPKTERVPKKVLDKNDFLNLLVAQLKNQDPMEPQSNEDFIATMAQFNSLETLSSLDKNTQYGQAMSMVGKTVTVQEQNKDAVTGTVEKAGVVDGKVVVYVGGIEYGISDVKEVHPQESSQIALYSGDLLQAAMLIGRKVSLDGDPEGVVEKVGMADGKVKIYVNGSPHDIADISEISSIDEDTASQPEPEVESQ